MKMLLTVEIAHEPFNSLVKSGKSGPVLRSPSFSTSKPIANFAL